MRVLPLRADVAIQVRTPGMTPAATHVRARIWRIISCSLGLLICAQLLLGAQAGAAPAVAKVFRAGAAMSNITPPLGAGIVGNFGTHPPAEHIHDQLYARCLVLDDSEKKLVIV